MPENRNPYQLSGFDITSRAGYSGRAAQFEALRDKVLHGQNTVILGAEGMGKTQFLNVAFNKAERKLYAQRSPRILVGELKLGITEEDAFYSAVADAMRRSLEILMDLPDPEARELFESMDRRAEREKKNASNGHSYLQAMGELFRREGCQGYLVIDAFEQFVNSRHTTKDQHDALRGFLVNNPLRLVVATDYDFNKSTLPKNAAGSLLLQLFSSNEIPLPGLTPAEAEDFLQSLSGAQDFNSRELNNLVTLSGGVPVLLCDCAGRAWAQKQEMGAVDWPRLQQEVLQENRPLFSRWARYLNQNQTDLLADRSKKDGLGPAPTYLLEDSLFFLIRRGLLRDTALDPDPDLRQLYNFASLAFRDYCRDEKPEPFQEPEEAPAPPLYPSIHIDNIQIVGEGGTAYAGNAQNNTKILNVTGIGLPELIHWIANPDRAELETSSFQQYLGQTLRQRMESVFSQLSLPEKDSIPKEEYEQIRDEQLSQLGEQLLPTAPVNEDNELEVEVDGQELVTVDQRFEAVRSRRPDLTDQVLQLQSERCQLYLKLSVIVEDALHYVEGMVRDYAPQLVLYGKAMEQALRDNLYPFLSSYDPTGTWFLPAQGKTFQQMDRDKTFIGQYITVLSGKKTELSDWCAKQTIPYDGNPLDFYGWRSWWTGLCGDTEKVKDIRNLVHAGSTPEKQDLDDMCGRMFGDQEHPGVLSRLTVGRELWYRLNLLQNLDQIHQLENKECRVIVARIKQGNALDCVLENGEYAVKISKGDVKKYLAAHPDTVLEEGMLLTARLGTYELQNVQQGKEYFHACLVE